MARAPKADPVLAEIGRRVEFLRQSKKLTREQLANAAGVSKTIVTRVEQAGGDVKLSTLRKLAGALGVPYLDLLAAPSSSPRDLLYVASAGAAPSVLAEVVQRLAPAFSDPVASFPFAEARKSEGQRARRGPRRQVVPRRGPTKS